MAERWWESAPLAETKKWWEAAPLKERTPEMTPGDHRMASFRNIDEGIRRGASMLVGMPGDLWNLGKTISEIAPDVPPARIPPNVTLPENYHPEETFISGAMDMLPTYNDVYNWGPEHEPYVPETGAGRIAQEGIAFGTGGLSGGWPLTLLMGITGVTSQSLEEAGAPEWASTATELGLPLLFGGGGAVVNALRNPMGVLGKTLRADMAGLTPEQTRAVLSDASTLMAAAQARGQFMTWPMALAQARGGGFEASRGLQRVIESQNSIPSAADIPTAARSLYESVMGPPAPAGPAKGALGPTMQSAADEAIQAPVAQGNRFAAPYYDGINNPLPPQNPRLDTLGGPRLVSEERMRPLLADPVFRSALAEIRRNPGEYVSREVLEKFQATGQRFENLPDNHPMVLDAVKKYASDIRQSTSPDRLGTSTRNMGDLAGDLSRVLRDTYPDYMRAMEIGSAARGVSEGLRLNTPLGRLAETDDVMTQARYIFKDTSRVDGETIRDTINAISREKPDLVEPFVRNAMDEWFSQSFKSLGPDNAQWGGGKFYYELLGTPEQKQVVSSVIRALPDGDMRWQAFNNMMRIFDAHRYRFKPGSATAPNEQFIKELGFSIRDPNVFRTVTTWLDIKSLQANSRKVAEQIMDPNNVDEIRRLANADPESLGALKLLFGMAVSQND